MAREAAIGSRMAVVSQGKESSSFAASGWSVEISAAAASCASPLTHSSGERNGFLLIEPESERPITATAPTRTPPSPIDQLQDSQNCGGAHIQPGNVLMGQPD